MKKLIETIFMVIGGVTILTFAPQILIVILHILTFSLDSIPFIDNIIGEKAIERKTEQWIEEKELEWKEEIDNVEQALDVRNFDLALVRADEIKNSIIKEKMKTKIEMEEWAIHSLDCLKIGISKAVVTKDGVDIETVNVRNFWIYERREKTNNDSSTYVQRNCIVEVETEGQIFYVYLSGRNDKKKQISFCGVCYAKKKVEHARVQVKEGFLFNGQVVRQFINVAVQEGEEITAINKSRIIHYGNSLWNK